MAKKPDIKLKPTIEQFLAHFTKELKQLGTYDELTQCWTVKISKELIDEWCELAGESNG